MGRRAGIKNVTHIPDELRSTHKSITLSNREWACLGDKPTQRASEILREWIARHTPLSQEPNKES